LAKAMARPRRVRGVFDGLSQNFLQHQMNLDIIHRQEQMPRQSDSADLKFVAADVRRLCSLPTARKVSLLTSAATRIDFLNPPYPVHALHICPCPWFRFALEMGRWPIL
jgi:hypothetical protein